MSILTILLSLLIGISFLVGLVLSKVIKQKWITYFATTLAFVMVIAMLATDIIPKMVEASYTYPSVWLAICGEIVGILILVIIDFFIPHHHHKHRHNDDNKLDHKEHLYHIGLLTLIAVVIHNLFEGFAFYVVAKTSIKSALIMAGVIAMHNISLGLEIFTYFGKNKKTDYAKTTLLMLSTTLGALIGLLVGDLSETISITVLSVTCGMMLYLGFFELGVESFNERKEKGILEGLLIGAIIFALMLW